ncbi:MAG: sensor histidine kinase [Alicyclobacillus shizuokensis]|nr:sensor histidine kinase [Alicyclobacillus shizuokensis]
MRLRDYVLDLGRLLSLACLGLGLFVLVVVLSLQSRGLAVPWADLLYGCLLAVLATAVGVLWEAWVRRPQGRALAARRAALEQGGAQPRMRLVGTREQRAWAALVNAEHAHNLRERYESERQTKFYEAFVTRFAHQMKTPLAVMTLLLAELRESVAAGNAGPATDAGQGAKAGGNRNVKAAGVAPLLDSLLEEKERLEASLEQLLQTARVTSFRFDARPERVDVVPLLREVVNEHKSAWIRRHLYPRIDAEAPTVYAWTDGKWLRFIAEQLVRNALQYGVPPGTDAGRPFVICVRRRGGDVVLAFRDQGIGIPQADLPRLFQPFFTGANGRLHSRATGIGLYLVKEVCERLGHDIQVCSTAGQGTTFTLTLHDSTHLSPAALSDDLTKL